MSTLPEAPPAKPSRSFVRRITRLIPPLVLFAAGMGGTVAYQSFARPTKPTASADPATAADHAAAAPGHGPAPDAHAAVAPPVAAPGHGPAPDAHTTQSHAHAEPAHRPAPENHGPAETLSPTVNTGAFAPAEAAIGLSEWARALKLLDDPAAPRSFDRQFRIALCHEGSAKWPLARKAFESALELATTAPAKAISGLGLVRCDMAEKKWDDADERLRLLYLTSGHAGCRRMRVAEQALAGRARIAVARLGPAPAPGPLAPTAFARPEWDDEPRTQIARLAVSGVTDPEAGSNRIVVTNRENRPRITGRVPTTTLSLFLAGLSTSSGLTVAVDPRARGLADATPVEFDVHNLPLTFVLAHLVEPAGLRVTEAGGRIEIAPGPAGAAKPAPGVALSRARDADPTNHALTLLAGSRALVDGRNAEAAKEYQSVLKESSESLPVTVAAYNLGLIRLGESQPRAAKAAFQAVVDAAASTAWVDLGQWWVARADLDLSDRDAAAAGFRRSRAAANPAIRSAGTLGLVACLFSNGEFVKGAEVLRERRVAALVDHERYAEVWADWARHRTTPTPTRAARLRDTLRTLTDPSLLGPTGVWLVGQAHRDVGDEAGMVRLYDREAKRTRGPLGERMNLVVAEAMDRKDLTSGARTRFQSLTSSTDPAIRTRARLAVAEIDLSLGRIEECLNGIGRVAVLPADERERALLVKARAYESMGRFQSAALCYAGRDPIE